MKILTSREELWHLILKKMMRYSKNIWISSFRKIYFKANKLD